MRRRALFGAALAGLLGVVLAVTTRGTAGPEKVAFPANFKSGVLYTTADRYDIKQYRELYTSPEAVRAAKDGKPLPHGTVITLVQYKAQVDAQGNPMKDARGRFMRGDLLGYAVMEKREGWGAEYPADLRNGAWEYSAFTADGKFNDKANYKACFQCHKPHDQIDFVISYPAMAGRVVASASPPAAGGVGVTISGFTFGSGSVSLAAGKAITWTNTDDSPHQIVVQGTSLKTDFVFKGQSASLTFQDAGLFNYNCALHPNMKGAVQVTK